MMFGGDGSGVPPGHQGRRSAIPPVNWRATVNGPYGTRDPSLSFYLGKRERPVNCPRVSPQAFDLAGITNTVGAPFLRVFLRRVGVGNAGAEFDHVPTTNSNSTRSIAAHPCKNATMRPSVGMVHAKIVKGGPLAPQHIPQWGWSVGGVWLGIVAETS